MKRVWAFFDFKIITAPGFVVKMVEFGRALNSNLLSMSRAGLDCFGLVRDFAVNGRPFQTKNMDYLGPMQINCAEKSDAQADPLATHARPPAVADVVPELTIVLLAPTVLKFATHVGVAEKTPVAKVNVQAPDARLPTVNQGLDFEVAVDPLEAQLTVALSMRSDPAEYALGGCKRVASSLEFVAQVPAVV